MKAFITKNEDFPRVAGWVVYLEKAHEVLTLDLEKQALEDCVWGSYFLKSREAFEKITLKEIKEAPEGRVMLCFLDID